MKDSLASTQSMILIARIKPIVSMDPQAEVKLVKELYSNNAHSTLSDKKILLRYALFSITESIRNNLFRKKYTSHDDNFKIGSRWSCCIEYRSETIGTHMSH